VLDYRVTCVIVISKLLRHHSRASTELQLIQECCVKSEGLSIRADTSDQSLHNRPGNLFSELRGDADHGPSEL